MTEDEVNQNIERIANLLELADLYLKGLEMLKGPIYKRDSIMITASTGQRNAIFTELSELKMKMATKVKELT